MYRNSQSADSELNKAMSNEQFNQVVDAILSGKYSWACLLILRFSGYNPLHYIPYRTYNRLMKTNREQNPVQPVKSPQKSPEKLQDLYYIEDLEHQSTKLKGGQRVLPINSESHWLIS